MKEQVMVYEIKSSANNNSDELFHPNNKYFYWNQKKFKNLEKDDFVIVVNTHSGYILYTKLDKKDIPVKHDEKNNKSSFKDSGEEFIVSGKYEDFIRLIIIKQYSIDDTWHWKSLGSSETTYLNGGRINTKASANRITNIKQLMELSIDDDYQSLLEHCLVNFDKNATISHTRKQSSSNQNSYMEEKTEILTAIQTKPFIILAGISGTGKSRLVRELAYKTCNIKELQKNDKPGNYELIPVKPNWHDSSELLGYISRINGEKYILTNFIRFIVKAWHYLDTPFFLCLDEMNLAPVEQYFAEYLSIIETRKTNNSNVITDAILDANTIGEKNMVKLLEELGISEKSELNAQFRENGIQIPPNLIVMGTVNMDETTHSFSRKVLDRAMTIEMNNVDLRGGLDVSVNDLDYTDEIISYSEIIGSKTIGADVYNKLKEADDILEYLEELNRILDNSPFKIAYRVRDEFLIYCYYHTKKKGSLDKALDMLTFMKVLSRIEGDEAKVKEILENLMNLFQSRNFIKSEQKISEMQSKLAYGYTSFWS